MVKNNFWSTKKGCEQIMIIGAVIGAVGSGAMLYHENIFWSAVIWIGVCLMFSGEILEKRISKKQVIA